MKTILDGKEFLDVCKLIEKVVAEGYFSFKHNTMTIGGVHNSGAFAIKYTTTLQCSFAEEITGLLDMKKLCAALKGMKETTLEVAQDSAKLKSGSKTALLRFKEPRGSAPKFPELKPFVPQWSCDVHALAMAVKEVNAVVNANRITLDCSSDLITVTAQEDGESASVSIEASSSCEYPVKVRFMANKLISVCEGVKDAKIATDNNYPLFVVGKEFSSVLAPLVDNN